MANKKKKTPKRPKESNIGSSSLLPARPSGEKPDIPFQIKTEIAENDVPQSQEMANNDIRDLFSLIEESKNQDTECSNDSISSTATEPMETEVEQDIVSFPQVHIKTEPTDMEISNNPQNVTSFLTHNILGPSESGVAEHWSNDHVNNSNKSEIFPPVANVQVKKELEEDEVSQDVASSNATVSIKLEPVENNENSIELKNDNSLEKASTKRKNFEAKLEIIRKRLKVEPNIDSHSSSNENQSISVLQTEEENIPLGEGSNNIQIKEENISDDEYSLDKEKDEIAVLPLPKLEKNVVVITLSDDEETVEQNLESQDVNMECNETPLQTSDSTSHAKSVKEKNFSTDILRYFSIVSELDRYDCQTALSYLEKIKTNNILEDFFPIVKKERKTPLEIKKGDILFKKITVSSSKAECVPISSNADCDIPESVSQYVNFSAPLAEPVLQQNNFSTPATELVLQNNNFCTAAAEPVLQHNFSTPLTLQLPKLPVASSSEKNVTLDPHLAAAIYNMCVDGNLQKLFDTTQKIQQITMPSTNVPITEPAETPLQDPHFKEGFSLQNRSKTQVSNIVNTHPSPPLPKTDFSKSSTYPISSNVSFVQLPNQRAPEPIASYPISHFEPLPNTSYLQAPPQVPSTSLSKNAFQKHSILNSANLKPKAAAVYSPLPTNRDPRLAVKQTAKFGPRKGVKELRLYRNIGKDTITQHFETLILQWNPSWVQTQIATKEFPPICDSYPNVVYFYSNEMAYYNTYVPLHFLHIWYNIFDCWVNQRGISVNCIVQFVDYVDKVFKISCSTELDDKAVWPKRDDILYCKHNDEEAFLLIVDVRKKPTNLPTIKKLKISLDTLHDLKLQPGDNVKVHIMLNMRTACMKIEALNSLDSSMKELVLKPDIYADSIEIVQLDRNITNIKLHRDAVLQAVDLDKARVIVIETYPLCDIIVLLTQISYAIIKDQIHPKKNPLKMRQEKVLIVLKNDNFVSKLFRRLSGYKPVLAVRTKLIQLSEEDVKCTLEDRLEKKENLNDILTDHHIFITTLSAFGSAEKAHLSKLKRLTCIIDDASICTEVETALLLTLKIDKLLLMGSTDRYPDLPDKLKDHRYHISLFFRLMKAKKML